MEIEFYDWLKTQFTDLESAKVFYKKWIDEMDQETPYGVFSWRAMAAHISNVLEGNEPDNNEIYTSYMSTKYGSDVMFSY
jgi:hypothetical protein